MNFDLVIKNGTIVTATTTYTADIGINGEHIAAIGESLSGHRELDATNKLVVPGGIDGHVHMQMPLPGDVISADDFFTGTRAAALGGTTTIVDFVAADLDESLMAAYHARRAEADPNVVIDYGLHMTIAPPDLNKLAELPAVVEAGCGSFKLYMAYGFRLKDDELLRALQAVKQVGGFPVIHAENWDVITQLIADNLAAGNTDPRWHPRSRPTILEGEAAGRAIDIAAYVGVPLHIFHVSCEAVVQRITAARQQGLPITGETCPQYLFLTDDTYNLPGIEGTLSVCSPPLRTSEDQAVLWRALAQDELQIVTTDHCPFTSRDKARGLHDFSQIPGGVPSIEGRYAMIHSFGVDKGVMSLNRWVDICATTPARLFGLSNKGVINVGFDADLVIFDPTIPKTLSTDTLHENVDWTPYEGLVVQGWPETTISRGSIVVEAGEFKGQAGQGKFVKRQYQ